ncbi:MAG TPA: TIGR01777 family oxidoreductase [Cytophagales bacterium]|nr:TIGR01777 family oxidoreductase [Cytophagales bacterium]
MDKKIVIAGGTGFLGQALIRKFEGQGYEIVVLTRKPKAPQGKVTYVQWDAKTLGPWATSLERSAALINLTGRSVNCRYTESNKKEMVASRVDATRILGVAILGSNAAPKVWINASSAAIFGYSEDEIKDEEAVLGAGFVSEICQQWEAAFHSATPHTRKVILRIGVVLQPKIGLLQPFVNLVKWGLGGKLGSGQQYFSWIHEADFLEIVHTAIHDDAFVGTFHATSPHPVKNQEFMRSLRQAAAVPYGIPNPSWTLKLGAVFIGTEAELVLRGRRVVPKRLQDQGFQFKYPHIQEAVAELLRK